MKKYNIIGLMSGTSLDGVDIALCSFVHEGNKWLYRIEDAVTVHYNDAWKNKLSSAMFSDAIQLLSLHKEYGKYLGKIVLDFVREKNLDVDFVSSHGHTVFHQPEKGLTLQIGDGSEIAAACGFPVVCDFRSADVALGGQGAPLVPIGDKLLFSDFDFCLNLGGFANVSFDEKGKRIAFDICPVNIVLNRYAGMLGVAFDKDGNFAEKGIVNKKLFESLNAVEYYSLSYPKSLGREWVEKNIFPLIEKYNISTEDKLRTYCEHAAFQISENLKSVNAARVLVTGGGAYNSFFISRIKKMSSNEIIIPDSMTVEFKEALIFAFLGLLRMENKINCLASVTGASRDHSSGCVFLP